MCPWPLFPFFLTDEDGAPSGHRAIVGNQQGPCGAWPVLGSHVPLGIMSTSLWVLDPEAAWACLTWCPLAWTRAISGCSAGAMPAHVPLGLLPPHRCPEGFLHHCLLCFETPSFSWC